MLGWMSEKACQFLCTVLLSMLINLHYFCFCVVSEASTSRSVVIPLQEQHEGDILQLQHACSAALSHVPLWNGAAVGPHLEQPDLDLLQLQLVHGMQLMDEAKPALQQLLGPDLLAAQTRGIADTAGSSKQQSHSGRAADTCSSVRATASLAEQLMCVATEESSLLGELAKRLDRLSDLHLYANSMQIQLAHMKQAAASD